MKQQATTSSPASAAPTPASPFAYDRVHPTGEDTSLVSSSSSSLLPTPTRRHTLINFIMMAILFSANHGCTVACLALATARLGKVGAWQSGTLYLTYTASAILGATYVTKRLKARNSIILGMALYCLYVACFWVATVVPPIKVGAALVGAAIGGIGGGFLWTAQGAYFTKAALEYAQADNDTTTTTAASSTSLFAGIFAFVYLAEEVALRALSSALLSFGIHWKTIFGIYTAVAVLSTLGMVGVYNYPSDDETPNGASSSVWYKVTAAWQLLRTDAKMKHMIGLNAVFGFASAFMNSYVNGEVVRVALHDDDSRFVGILSALVAAVAAVCSLLFARLAQAVGKGPVLILGAMAFFFVGFIFILVPNIDRGGWGLLILVYTLQGMGRATFESTLKAIFADYFVQEKEGAFANIILQNGLSSSIGFFLSFRLACSEQSAYCVQYKDGSLHNVLAFELLVVITAIAAVLGYWRASIIYQHEQEQPQIANGEAELLESENGVST